jgi:Ca-activated chloride channel family protein
MRLWCVGLLGLAMAQQQQAPAPVVREMPQAPTLHIESRLVTVALNVTDEHGAPVAGLRADDLLLSEDGAPQRIAFFEKESTTPLDIVIAVDASESTFAESHLERDAMKTFVKSLVRPQDRVELISFSDTVDEVVPFTSDDKRIDSGFGEIKRGDATALYDAVYLAAQRLMSAPMVAVPQSAGARRVIVLITDGENTTHHGTYDMAIEEAERAGAMVYSLIVVPVVADAGRNTGGEHALIQMSRDTGGKYYEIVAKQDVPEALAHVSDDLRTQYTVGYYAPRKVLDDRGLRHIQLQLKDAALAAKDKLRYRTAYYAR